MTNNSSDRPLSVRAEGRFVVLTTAMVDTVLTKDGALGLARALLDAVDVIAPERAG